MINYVNEQKFLEWYKSVSNNEKVNETELLNDTYMIFCTTGKAEFVVAASRSKSGKDETYKYKVENIGCCGASTIVVTF